MYCFVFNHVIFNFCSYLSIDRIHLFVLKSFVKIVRLNIVSYIFLPFHYYFYFHSNLFCWAQGPNLRPIWPILRHEFEPKQPYSFKPTNHQLRGPNQSCFSTSFHARPMKPNGQQGWTQLAHGLLALCSFFSRTSSRRPSLASCIA